MEDIKELVVLDVETTGLNPVEDRIVEIALIRIQEGKVEEKFVTLLNPEIKIPPETSSIHGITDEQIKESPQFRDIAERIFKMIKGKILLVHNADFDISFLKNELGRCGFILPDIKVIDTLTIARSYFCFPSNSLSAIARYYNIDISGAHRAEADAMMTYKIYCKLMEELGEKNKFDKKVCM